RGLRSFPTRRSSDLSLVRAAPIGALNRSLQSVRQGPASNALRPHRASFPAIHPECLTLQPASESPSHWAIVDSFGAPARPCSESGHHGNLPWVFQLDRAIVVPAIAVGHSKRQAQLR